MPKMSADWLKQRIGQEWIRTTEGVKPADLQSANSLYVTGSFPGNYWHRVARSRTKSLALAQLFATIGDAKSLISKADASKGACQKGACCMVRQRAS
jgi:hypothetical protein